MKNIIKVIILFTLILKTFKINSQIFPQLSEKSYEVEIFMEDGNIKKGTINSYPVNMRDKSINIKLESQSKKSHIKYTDIKKLIVFDTPIGNDTLHKLYVYKNNKRNSIIKNPLLMKRIIKGDVSLYLHLGWINTGAAEAISYNHYYCIREGELAASFMTELCSRITGVKIGLIKEFKKNAGTYFENNKEVYTKIMNKTYKNCDIIEIVAEYNHTN